ncbi:MAG: cupin domain-containing protein [Ilumatobacteraceae bacterium]
MKLVRQGDRSDTYGGRFTGPVELEMLHEAETSSEPDLAHVHFHDGAVSNWHQHPGGQRLFVSRGVARVGTESDGAIELHPGDLVVSPPDERHWHGAAPGQDASLLAITWGVTEWEDLAPE